MPSTDDERKAMRRAAEPSRAHYHPRQDGKEEWRVTQTAPYPVFKAFASDVDWYLLEKQRREERLMGRFLAQTRPDEDYGEEEEEEEEEKSSAR